MGPFHAKKSSKPRSIDGWSLDIAVRLDAAAPGFLSFLLCASALRRQAILMALAELLLGGPESLATRLRPLTPADGRHTLSPYEQIARALMVSSRVREIIHAVYGQVPDGLLGVLHRLGDAPLPKPGSYRTLFELFGLPEHRFRAKALMQHSGSICAMHIGIVQRLDRVLVHKNVLKRLYGTSQADDANAALAVIRGTVSSANDDAIRQSIENLGEKTDLATLFRRWLEKMDLPPARPSIPADDPDVVVMTSGDAMSALGRRYRNCAATKVPLVALGVQAYLEWRHEPGAIGECRRLTSGDWVLTEIHALANGRVDPAAAAALRRKLQTFGIPALSPGEIYPRSLGIARLLGVWDLTDDLGFGDDDHDEDGLAARELDLGEAADVA
ncbi:hypothetical protein [Microvirga massiliensis]|uniref:hypothetical protein n=1 Tax=Microvirga massiliensis TaxID=1033741 RepID=UPI00062BAB16|nr:hypothetical protein [Microvirga massiliensis]